MPRQILDEMLRSPLAEVDSRESAEAKMNQSTVEQMIGGKFATAR